MRAQEATYGRWAAERLALVPGRELHPDLARVDYFRWLDPRARRAPRSKQRAAIRAVGGRFEGTGRQLRYLDVTLLPWAPDDSGYRARSLARRSSPALGPEAVEAALVELYRVGLARDSRALDEAYLRLSGAPGRLCNACGRLTRRPDRHLACDPTSPARPAGPADQQDPRRITA